MADQRRSFSPQKKQEILEAIRSGKKTVQEIEKEYLISRHFHIARWAKIYGVDLSQVGRGSNGHSVKMNTTPSIPLTSKEADARDKRIMELVYALGVASEKITRLEAQVHGKRFADKHFYSND